MGSSLHLAISQISGKDGIRKQHIAIRRMMAEGENMLSILFAICMIWFIGKFFVFGLKASWGIMKLLCVVVFFPVILIGMVAGGLLYIAFPILIIGGIIALVVSKS